MLIPIALAAIIVATTSASHAGDVDAPYGPQLVGTVARILLSAEARNAGVAPPDIVIQDVVASGNHAILSYKIGPDTGLIALVRTERGWTLRLRATPAGGEAWSMEAYPPLRWASSRGLPFGPDSQVLLEAGLSQAVVYLAATHNAVVKAASLKESASYCARRVNKTHPCFEPMVDFCCPGGTWEPRMQPHGAHFGYPGWFTDGYGLSFGYSTTDAPPKSHFNELFSEALPIDSKAIFQTKLSMNASSPATFQKFTVDLWCPFVLKPGAYRLRLDPGDGTFIHAAGTLRDNVLHFVIPSLTMQPGAPIAISVSS
jgi:hypothetical protein